MANEPKGNAAPHSPDTGRVRRITVPAIRSMKARERIAMVTAYDATFAQMIDEGGADMLLVGDSLGMVVQGLDSTLPVTVDEIIYHCRAVARGARRALLVGDLPFMSWQLSTEQALKNAARFLSEGAMQAVKLEGGVEAAETIRKLVSCGIPGEQLAEGDGGPQRVVGPADAVVALDETVLLDEPGPALARRFEPEFGFVEEVQWCRRGLGLFQASEKMQQAVFSREGSQLLERVGARGLAGEDERDGLDLLAGHPPTLLSELRRGKLVLN